ncbi:hypothetical protein DPEC_G00319260 [Dallia pectoralis]|uniref:Uncharacterized protein n=1 Tax=Dallia pectoralis TaxID=75939 RepID=A0ACC2F9K4_DALPE|nr:hypothetical protein DPEC_G00319260 [Dallia pectoralis]
MAGREDAKGKVDLLEDTRMDSGIESLQTSMKDEPFIEPARDSTRGPCETRDKVTLNTEERLDSAYGSTVESLTEIMGSGCEISKGDNGAEKTEFTEHEENLLTTISEDGDTVLHLAVIHEDEDFAHQLIQLYPMEVLDIQNNLYQTPLHLATYLSLVSVVRSLVVGGASLGLQDQEGNTPLHVACELGRAACAVEMTQAVSACELNSLLETQNWRGLTCLHLAIVSKQHRLIEILMTKGADLDIQEGTSGKTPLHLAVELHDVDSVTQLLHNGANVDAAMFNGCTPLHLAVGRQDITIADLLCHSGADRMLRNMEGETPLDLADGKDDILALFPFDDIQIQGRSVIRVPF